MKMIVTLDLGSIREKVGEEELPGITAGLLRAVGELIEIRGLGQGEIHTADGWPVGSVVIIGQEGEGRVH